jgi:hypothetical protein
MKTSKTKKVSKQQLGRIRNKIEEFKRKQRKQKIHTKLYVDTNKTLDIYKTIDAIQQLPPYSAVKKGDIAARKPNFGDRQIRRALELLCRLKFLVIYPEGQYWIPKYMEKNSEYQRKENERKDKIIEEQKRTQKRLLEENIATVEMAKPYLDNLRYCDSDEDWELLSKWFMKMQENKQYQEEAEAWKEDMESQAEVNKANPTPELSEEEKTRLKKLLK